MGIYDVNLKKTGIGYQFDHNVYIGIQTNDNRVVTFKDLDDAVATQIAAAGGEDIELFITQSEAGAHEEFGDRISFHRNNTEYVYDIAPQYVTSPGQISSEDFGNSKVCLLKPVFKSESDQTIIGYQIYTSDYAPASLLTLNIGTTAYTYDGSTGVTINFDTIPTINAASVDITTSINSISPSGAIPTDAAVLKALAWAPGIATVTPSSVTAAPAVITSIAYSVATHSLNYEYITQDFDSVTLNWGEPVQYASIGNTAYSITLPTVNTIPTINADSVNIVTEIPESDSSTDIPTAGAVHKFASAAGSLRITEAANGYLVGVGSQPTSTTQTLAPVGSSSIKWATTATSAGTANQWINANITGRLNHTLQITVAETTKAYDGSADVSWAFSNEFTTNNAGAIALNAELHNNANLNWGTPVSYGSIAGQTKTLTLPTVNTIPTINASSVEISISVPSQDASNSKIPTEKAVFDALAMAPGISSVTATGAAGMMTSLTYDSADHILSYTQTTATISGQTVALGGNSVTVPSLGSSHNQAAYGDHTHSTFTVFGQTYNGSSSKTVSASTGIAVSAGEVSLDATFHDPTLEWGASKSYAVVAGSTHYITLPTVNTIPTINASSVSITTSISSSTSTAIPTEGAVSAAIAGAVPNIAAGNNITVTTDGSTKTISLDLINHWINYGSTHDTHMATDGVGHIHLYDNFEYQILDNNDPVVMVQPQAIYINPNASTTNSVSLTINTYGISAATNVWVPAVNSSSGSYAAVNKGYVDTVGMTYDAATNVVTFTNAAGSSISFTTASDWADITGKPTFFTANLDWSTPAKFAQLGNVTYNISLPSVSTIPTINASSIAITGTISGTTDIPTDQAVSIALAGYVPKSAFTYNATTGVLTLTIPDLN